MSRKTKNLVIGAVLIALLAVCYFVVTAQVKKIEQDGDQDPEMILSQTADVITGISISHGDETISFTKNDDTWTLQGDDTFEVDQDTVATLVSSLTGVAIVRTIPSDGAEALSEYGLDTPSYILTVTDKDGTETQLAVGNQNATNSNYYVYKDGDTSVLYTVGSSLMTNITDKTVEDFRKVEATETPALAE